MRSISLLLCLVASGLPMPITQTSLKWRLKMKEIATRIENNRRVVRPKTPTATMLQFP
jgi:hypothetical protein